MTEIPQPESKADECGQNEKNACKLGKQGLKEAWN